MRLELAHTDALVARRRRLSEALGGSPALLFSGHAPPRNYEGAPYAFRASSHFLYLAGVPLEGAALRVGEQSCLYLPRPDADDALWHGAQPSFDAIADAVGCPVRPFDELETDGASTIAAVDLRTRSAQASLLGRAIHRPSEADLALADALIALRLVHDDAAVSELREAARGTTAAHLAGMAATRPGGNEAEVRAAMEGALAALGMGTAYGSIVTVHGEVLHNSDSYHRTAEGDLLLADVGAETPGGWAGDVTRTWPVSGQFTATQRAMYEVVLDSQVKAIEAAAPGVSYREVHLVACRSLAAGLVDLGVLIGDPEELVQDGVHALFFPHGTGHLLGLDVHDMEDLGDRAGYAPGRERSAQFGLSYLRLDRDLEAGMAVTIEPGFYRVPAILEDPTLSAIGAGRIDRAELEKFGDVRGIRIEDDVLITTEGREVLTSEIPKTADAVERATRG